MGCRDVEMTDGDVEMAVDEEEDETHTDGVARLSLGHGAPPARGLRMNALRRLALEGPCDSVAEVFASLALDKGAKLQLICHLPSPRTDAFLSTYVLVTMIFHWSTDFNVLLIGCARLYWRTMLQHQNVSGRRVSARMCDVYTSPLRTTRTCTSSTSNWYVHFPIVHHHS